MIIQFPIVGKSGQTMTYKIADKKYYRNGTEIPAEEYNKALEYFNANRKK